MTARGSTTGREPLAGDTRGAVYIEFILAFMPVFLLFLGTVQLGLAAVARIVVQHAATRAVRTAVVVLEDDPKEYRDAPRGDLEAGADAWEASAADVLRKAGGRGERARQESSEDGPQQGARMKAIRFAARAPLAILAPTHEPSKDVAGVLEIGIRTASAYTQAASTITIQDGPGSDLLARAQVPSDHGATVTVRVSYLYTCGVPVMRRVLCNSPRDLGIQEQWKRARLPDTARLQRMVAEATLPNQGAGYED